MITSCLRRGNIYSFGGFFKVCLLCLAFELYAWVMPDQWVWLIMHKNTLGPCEIDSILLILLEIFSSMWPTGDTQCTNYSNRGRKLNWLVEGGREGEGCWSSKYISPPRSLFAQIVCDILRGMYSRKEWELRCIEKANQEEEEEKEEGCVTHSCVTANLFPTLHPCFPLPH